MSVTVGIPILCLGIAITLALRRYLLQSDTVHLINLVKFIGVNEIGEGNPSEVSTAKTTNQEPAQMPKYKLLNRAENGKVSEHIINATIVKGAMQP